jgi:hypothetical protein
MLYLCEAPTQVGAFGQLLLRQPGYQSMALEQDPEWRRGADGHGRDPFRATASTVRSRGSGRVLGAS